MHNLVSVSVPSPHSEALVVRALLPTDQTWDNEQITLALQPRSIHWFAIESGDAVYRNQVISVM